MPLFPAPAHPPIGTRAAYALPTGRMPGQTSNGVPSIFSSVSSAGPDESFFLDGAGLGGEVHIWAPGKNGDGQEVTPKVQTSNPAYLIATIPQNTPDGVYVGEVGRNGGSAWFRLNAPDPWWVTPDRARPGSPVDLFGDELAVRPDRVEAKVYLENPNGSGEWASVTTVGRYRVVFRAPQRPGSYRVWVYGGSGGDLGWGGPVSLHVSPSSAAPLPVRIAPGIDLQRAIDSLGAKGGELLLAPGRYSLKQTLRVPAGVAVRGVNEAGVILQTVPGATLTSLNGNDTPVAWLEGDGAGFSSLTLIGSPASNTGVEIGKDGSSIDGASIIAVKVAGIQGTSGENAAVRIVNGVHLQALGCDLTARTPFFIRGMAQSRLAHNWLHSATRYGGNSEAAILARTRPIHQNVIEDNIVDSVENAGVPTARRLLWFSTGLGSVSDNYIGGNIGKTAFGGVPGTDQNVGETILFETNMRVAYYGPPTGSGPQTVTLPATGPFWPPAKLAANEAPQNEYYLFVVRGPGLGQVRRVVRREGNTIFLDTPWQSPPGPDSLVLEALTFAHNIVVGNSMSQGMSGIQLWIGGFRNIFADNVARSERKQGIFLFGALSTADATMPNRWNAGIGPLFYNTVEGNRVSDTDQGILLGIGDNRAAVAAAHWPRALGTVIRHNTVTQSRSVGVDVSGGAGPANETGDLSVLGTIAEFNLCRNAPTAFSASPRTVATLFRRNLAYFWNLAPATMPRLFAVAGASLAVGDDNVAEGPTGEGSPTIQTDLSAPAG